VTEALHRLKRTVRVAPRDQTGGERRSNPGETLQFCGRREVHIDRQDRSRDAFSSEVRPLPRAA
jgi:hypothetical protein